MAQKQKNAEHQTAKKQPFKRTRGREGSSIAHPHTDQSLRGLLGELQGMIARETDFVS